MINRNTICTNTVEFAAARVVTFANPYSFVKMAKADIDFYKFDKVCIDGVVLKIFLNLVYRDNSIERMSFDFTSVAGMVFEKAVANAEHGFVLGSDQTSNDEFLKKIAEMYPGIELGGRSGYFDTPEELSGFLESLSETKHDFVIIGMGAVKQEEVAIALVNHGFKGRIYTCGGFIHQTAMSGGEYYPPWIDRYNLRFAYRMYKEPSTILRYLIEYPKALFFLTTNIRKFKH